MSTRPGLELSGIARRFGLRWALRGVDLRVERGETIALTGRNGSGKTTLLRICSTLLRPTRGHGSIFGSDIVQDADRVRSFVGFLAHHAGVYDDLTAAENLRFAARMIGIERSRQKEKVSSVLDRVGLIRESGERVRGFSAGMRRRLALARLLLQTPSLLLLDEPYASFDAEGVELVNALALDVVRADGIALIATHDLTRATGTSREVRLEEGRITTLREEAAGVRSAISGG